jgi:hypothetical protein
VRRYTADIRHADWWRRYIIPGCGDFGDKYFGTDKFDYVVPGTAEPAGKP